jgi:hypothetical protein
MISHNLNNTQLEAKLCPANSLKNNAKQLPLQFPRRELFELGPTERRARIMSSRRQAALRLRRLAEAEGKGEKVHTRCACGCGLGIKPSIKRPYARGHAIKGVLRVVRVLPTPQDNSNRVDTGVKPIATLTIDVGCRLTVGRKKLNFCPDCFEVSTDGKKRYGMYMPNDHVCGEQGKKAGPV